MFPFGLSPYVQGSYGLSDFGAPLTSQMIINLRFEHYMVHAGRAFGLSYYVDSVPGLGAEYLMLETGSKLVHLAAEYRVSQDFKWELFFGPTSNPDGNLLEPKNFRFDLIGNPAYACESRFRQGMTGLVNGTLFSTRYLPSGGKGVGSQVTELAIETVFDRNSTYLVKYTNLTNQAARFNVLIDLYELDLPS